ncbi:hypothetical protein BS17DRAFT_791448 [Gyrodon lividus]|nr:hypothetical protein BS17DRAFT_791506 [Gyrodon lividus]KAF9218431.1 hypothetical protein BS17DRAFT_791448 [Gyrodon lividus]
MDFSFMFSLAGEGTHSFNITMYYVIFVHIDKAGTDPAEDIRQICVWLSAKELICSPKEHPW